MAACNAKGCSKIRSHHTYKSKQNLALMKQVIKENISHCTNWSQGATLMRPAFNKKIRES